MSEQTLFQFLRRRRQHEALVVAVRDLIAGSEATGKPESHLRWAVRRAYHGATGTRDGG